VQVQRYEPDRGNECSDECEIGVRQKAARASRPESPQINRAGLLELAQEHACDQEPGNDERDQRLRTRR
jgi:hypothetical protein